MNDAEALLAAIRADPADDVARLAYADWLEENSQTQTIPCPTCSSYADEKCPECNGRCGRDWHPRDDPTNSRMEGPVWMRCQTCDGEGRFPPGYHPERDAGSGRREGGWTNCKTCNGSTTRTPGHVERTDGRRERAEFIRVQVELWPLRDAQCKGFSWHTSDCRDAHRCNRAMRLRERERALFAWENINLWGGRSHCWQRTTTDRSEFDSFDYDVGIALFHRGFVAEVRCPWKAWKEHGAAIVAIHPVERVELAGAKPWEGQDTVGAPVEYWGWWAENGLVATFAPVDRPWALPAELMRILAGDVRQKETPQPYDAHDSTGCVTFGSPDLAMAALSDALLAFARNVADVATETAQTQGD